MSGVGDRIAPTGMILVGVGAAQAQGLAVEEESLVRRELEPAEARPNNRLVPRPAVLLHRHSHRIELRVVGMPE